MSTENEEPGIVDDAKQALTNDAEVPIDKKAPGSTFVVVALSYLAILAIGALVLAAILWAVDSFSGSEVEATSQLATTVTSMLS